jgi:hypothetical protein
MCGLTKYRCNNPVSSTLYSRTSGCGLQSNQTAMRFLANLKSTVFLVAVACAGSTSTHSDDVSGLYALVKRHMPSHSNAFAFNLSTTASPGLDIFTVRSASHDEGDGNAEISIECTTINACARGLYTCVKFGYLRNPACLNSPLNQLCHRIWWC